MFLRQKVPWTMQPPTGTPINVDNSLARNLVLVISGTEKFDLISKSVGTIGSSDVRQGGGKFGEYLAGGGALQARRYNVPATVGNSYTVVAVVRDLVTGAIRNPFDSDDSSTGGAARVFQLRMSSANKVEFIPFNTTPTPFVFTGTTTINNTDRSVVVATMNGITGATALYLNGKVEATGTITGTAQALGNKQVSLCDSNGSTTQPFSGEVYCAGIAMGAWSFAEALSFCDNPWQIFQP